MDMSFYDKVVTRFQGEPARLRMTDSDGDTFDMRFPNNYQMRQAEKRIKELGFDYEIIFKRTEWLKGIGRIWWITETIYFAYEIVANPIDNPFYRLFVALAFAFYIYTFKQYVITLDY